MIITCTCIRYGSVLDFLRSGQSVQFLTFLSVVYIFPMQSGLAMGNFLTLMQGDMF